MLEREPNYPDYTFQKTERTIRRIPSEALAHMERIPQGEVIDLVTEIGMFYDLPQETYLHGISIPAFRMDLMTLIEMAGSYQKGLPEAIAVNTGRDDWAVIISEDERPREKRLLAHELIHGLRRTRSVPSKTTMDQYAHYVSLSEEAVVSILETSLIYKDIPLLIDEENPKGDTILRRVLREWIEMPYGDQVVAMLALMQGTRCGSNPLTLQELAKRYFNDGMFFTRDLLRELKARIPQEDEEAYRKNFEMLTW